MNRPRRLSPFSALLGLALLLFGIIVLILVIRQPWAIPPATATPAATPSGLAEDPRQIVFMSNRDGDWDLYQLTLASGDTINLTNTTTDEAFPAYDFAGQAVSYISSADRPTAGELTGYIMAADGSNQRRVQNDLATILDVLANGRINWDRVEMAQGGPAFVTLRDLNLEVYQTRTDAGGAISEVNVSQNGAVDWFPSLDLTGARLVFSSERSGDQDIFLVEADGTLRRLTDFPADDLHAVWLSDNRQLLLYSERDTTFDGGQTVLYTLDTADPGAQPVRLEGGPVSLDNGTPLIADIQFDGGAQLSLGYDGNDWEIYYTPAGGGAPVNLTDNDSDDLFPAWRPAQSAGS